MLRKLYRTGGCIHVRGAGSPGLTGSDLYLRFAQLSKCRCDLPANFG